MKPKGEKRGFTIIELLTVMSIIIILISLLVPSLNRVRRVAKGVAQRAQFYDIEKALEEYRAANDDEYPDSGQFDTDPCRPYCGAMKLAEAMIGQDGMGLHEDSLFHADGLSADDSIDYYLFDLSVETDASSETLAQRLNRGQRIKYLENDDVGRCKLREMFPVATPITPFDDSLTNAVLCDVFVRTQITTGNRAGDKVGMPVLYYKADVRKLLHDFVYANLSIYNYKDNIDLLDLGLPWDPSGLEEHPIAADPCEFYEVTQNKDIITTPTPYKKDQYILISAGYDGRYGTRDDIFNFRR